MKTLSREQARRVYDRIGSFQDAQAFYEDRAVQEMTEHSEFGKAERVFEFGCGTGRYAQRLLLDHLPEQALYLGVDISPTMIQLAHQRLASFAPRGRVELSDGSFPGSDSNEISDRFVSNYVLDLLSVSDIHGVLQAAHARLRPGGLLCLTSLSFAPNRSSRIILAAWSLLRAVHPVLVGGCRPLSLLDYISEPLWEVRPTARVVQYGVPSQVVIAARA